METLKLKKPLLVNGKDIHELNYDLDGLTAFDMDRAGKLLKDDGSFANIMEFDSGYHYKLFCVAATKQCPDIAMSDMERLGARDYAAAARSVRRFLLSSSEDLSPEDTSEE